MIDLTFPCAVAQKVISSFKEIFQATTQKWIIFIKGAVNGCCTTPANVIKLEIKYSILFRDKEKVEYLIGVCQCKLKKSNYFATNWYVRPTYIIMESISKHLFS